MSEDETPRPVLRVVRGNPDDAELAALLAVTASAGTAEAPEKQAAPRSRWADRETLLGAPLRPGAGAWRASALPRR